MHTTTPYHWILQYGKPFVILFSKYTFWAKGQKHNQNSISLNMFFSPDFPTLFWGNTTFFFPLRPQYSFENWPLALFTGDCVGSPKGHKWTGQRSNVGMWVQQSGGHKREYFSELWAPPQLGLGEKEESEKAVINSLSPRWNNPVDGGKDRCNWTLTSLCTVYSVCVIKQRVNWKEAEEDMVRKANK